MDKHNIRLFVDVDDTLVIYDDGNIEPHPYGIYHGVPWTINEKLLQGIKDFVENNPDSLVVVWSGGGWEYAKYWADKLNLYDSIAALTKDSSTFYLIHEGDIVVDDMDLGGLRTHKPDEWPEKGE